MIVYRTLDLLLAHTGQLPPAKLVLRCVFGVFNGNTNDGWAIDWRDGPPPAWHSWVSCCPQMI